MREITAVPVKELRIILLYAARKEQDCLKMLGYVRTLTSSLETKVSCEEDREHVECKIICSSNEEYNHICRKLKNEVRYFID